MAQVAMIVAGTLQAYSSFRGGQYARAEYDAKAAQ